MILGYNSHSRPYGLAFVAACFGLALTAAADTVVPAAWKQSNAFSAARIASNLSNAVGMDSTETLLYNLDGSQPGEPNGANGVSWLTSSKANPNNLTGRRAALTDGKVWIVADLGASYDLGTIRIWNWQWNLNGTTNLSDRGVNGFDIYVRNTAADTDDGMEDGTPINLTRISDENNALTDSAIFNIGTANPWTLALKDQSLARAPNNDTTHTAESYDLTGQTARFVAIVPRSYYGGAGVGLGKVRIEGTPAAETGLRLTITPALAPATGYDLEWNSQPGKLYHLRSSTGLDTPRAGWEIVQADIVATPPANLFIVQSDGPRRFYAVEEFDAPPIFIADFEASDGGFAVVNHSGGTGTVWEWGDPDSTGPGGTVSTGNGGSTNCWGTKIGNPGIYATGTDTSLVSPVIDLGAVPNALLSFAQAIDILAGDTFLVNVIDADISSGITVLQAAVHTSTPDPDTTSANWQTVSGIAITGGRPVRIEWRFTGDNDGSYIGAYIDDVKITAAP